MSTPGSNATPPEATVPAPARPLPVFQRHWVGFIFLLPYFTLETQHHARVVAERVTLMNPNPSGPYYEYHLSPLTLFLGHALIWVLFGGMIAFLLHAIYLHRLKRGGLWRKLIFLPLYFALAVIQALHVD